VADAGLLARGAAFGRYEVVSLIGRGRSVDVYNGKIVGAAGFEKAVALKIPTQAAVGDSDRADAFVARAKRAFALSHANILGIIDLGRAELDSGSTLTYLVTELARGLSLHDLVARAQAARSLLPLGAVFRLGADIAKALDHAHRRPSPIAHGALAEGKVFITREGQLKLGDFALQDPGEGDGELAPEADLRQLAAMLGRLVASSSDALSETAASFIKELGRGSISDAALAHDSLLELSFAVSTEREGRSLARVFASGSKPRGVPEIALLREAELDAALTDGIAVPARLGRFVGRVDELSVIAVALSETLTTGAQRRSVIGPAGVGKTRLMREFSRRVPLESVRSAFVSCSPALAHVSLGGIAVAIRALASLPPAGRLDPSDVTRSLRTFGCESAEINSLAGILGVPIPSPELAERAPAHEALLSLVSGVSGCVPVLLVFDDAGELDPASDSLLSLLVESQRAREVPLLIAQLLRSEAASGREGEPPRPHQVAPLLSVDELGDDSVAQLLANGLGARVIPPELFELVASRAGGNPLFIETIVKELSDSALVEVRAGVAQLSASSTAGLAASLSDIARDKVSRLSPYEQRALATMTVIDGGADTPLLSAALGIAESEASALAASLEAQGVARRGPGGELFAATLYRDAALYFTDAASLRETHLRAARFLRAEDGASDRALRLVQAAEHFSAAEAMPEAALAFCEAARAFEKVGAADAAASLFARALPALGAADEAARSIEALTRLAERADLASIDIEEGIANALALSDTILDRDARVALRARLAVALARHRALELADVLLDQAEAISAPVLAGVVVTARLAVAAAADDPERARDALHLFATEVSAAGSPSIDVWLDAIDVALLAGDATRARSLLEVLPEADATVAQRARVLACYAWLALDGGDAIAAASMFDQAIAIAKLGGDADRASSSGDGPKLSLNRSRTRALLERAELELDAGETHATRAFSRLTEAIEWARTAGDRATLELALSELEALEKGPPARAAIELRAERARAEGRHYDSLRLSMVIARRLYGRDIPALEALAAQADAAGLGGLAKRARRAKEPATILTPPRV